jgi:NTE family protein
MKIGIALGGGGAKGLAHIGVLEVIEEAGIKPNFVAGTSIGSIIGGIYALDGTAKNLRKKARAMIESEEFKDFGLDEFYKESGNIFEKFRQEVFEKFYFGRLLFKRSHVKKDTTKKLFHNLFADQTFDDCKYTFTCNALDIQCGKEVVFTSGSLVDAVWSSCAIPGIFPPFEKDDRILVDGGVIDNIPVRPVRDLGARVIIASYLGHQPEFKGRPETGFQISHRAQSFVRYHLDQKILEPADLVIKPEVDDFHWADFAAVDELVKAGRAAAKSKIKEIKSVTSFWYRLRKKLSTTI